MTITLRGVLAEDARYGRGRVNDAVITLNVAACSDPSPKFEARLLIGDTEQAHIHARAQADLYRRGSTVEITAAELAWCSDHGTARFIARRLSACTIAGMPVL